MLWQLPYQSVLKDIKVGEFLCSHFNIEGGRKSTSFLAYSTLLFQWGKNQQKCKKKKDLCSVWRRCRDWSNVSKVVCKVLCWRFLAGWCSVVRLIAIKSRHWEQSMLYHMGDRWHTQNIQINKVTGENEKCVFHFTEKTKTTFLANTIHCCSTSWYHCFLFI